MPAGQAAVLVVKILGDSSGATRALAQTDAAVMGTADATGRAGKSMIGVWQAVAGGMAVTAKAASDLEQATGAVEQIFGTMAPEMMEFAEGMAAYGLSTAQAAQASAILGAQLMNAGIPMEQTAVLVQELIMLATDMAAVFGGTVPEAVAALGAALRGEYDTLERYGVSLTADAVSAEALRLSQEGVTFASEQQAKMVAVLSLIWQQTAEIQGAAAEESDTLAASMGALRAAVTNLAAAIGAFLIPILVPVIELITTIITGITGWIEESVLLEAAVNALARVLEMLQPILEAIAKALDMISRALEVVIGWIQQAIKWFERLIDVVAEAWDSLTFWNDKHSMSTAAATGRLGIAAPAGYATRGRATPVPMAAAPRPVVVQGLVLDPDGIARQIRKLDRDSRRRGWVPVARGVS